MIRSCIPRGAEKYAGSLGIYPVVAIFFPTSAHPGFEVLPCFLLGRTTVVVVTWPWHVADETASSRGENRPSARLLSCIMSHGGVLLPYCLLFAASFAILFLFYEYTHVIDEKKLSSADGLED